MNFPGFNVPVWVFVRIRGGGRNLGQLIVNCYWLLLESGAKKIRISLFLQLGRSAGAVGYPSSFNRFLIHNGFLRQSNMA